MTQHELIIEYIRENGYIIPAKLDGKRAFRGDYIGSQADKRCRELRKPIKGKWCNPYGKQMLDSAKEGRFERFFLLEEKPEKVFCCKEYWNGLPHNPKCFKLKQDPKQNANIQASPLLF